MLNIEFKIWRWGENSSQDQLTLSGVCRGDGHVVKTINVGELSIVFRETQDSNPTYFRLCINGQNARRYTRQSDVFGRLIREATAAVIVHFIRPTVSVICCALAPGRTA